MGGSRKGREIEKAHVRALRKLTGVGGFASFRRQHARVGEHGGVEKFRKNIGLSPNDADAAARRSYAHTPLPI